MIIYQYDKSFEGLLSCVFEAYERKIFPETLQETGTPLPLFYDDAIQVFTDPLKANRVWKGLTHKLSPAGLSVIASCWLSELPESDILLFRYIRKAIDAPSSIELQFGDPDILKASQIAKKVNNERLRVIQFIRFQKTIDNTYFAATEPLYNVLPLVTEHFQDRFSDQNWLLYDVKRTYGYYYDLHAIKEIQLKDPVRILTTSPQGNPLLAPDEILFQKLWQTYFKSIAIQERINPQLHRQHLPVRFWKYLTEKKSL